MLSITVAILTFNRGRTGCRSIRSVAKESRCNVVVFDDCSNAHEYEQIRRCCERFRNVRLVRNERNIGFAQNLIQALTYLASSESELVFLCESDMLMCDNWLQYVEEAFALSDDSIAMSPMLHVDQLRRGRSEEFRQRCLFGGVRKGIFSRHMTKPFGSSYEELPDEQEWVRLRGFKVRYVSNSIATLIYRRRHLCLLLERKSDLLEHKGAEDAWLCWALFATNKFNPKSLMALDPGLALTIGSAGLNGFMPANNLRWYGSFVWRNPITATVIRAYYRAYVLAISVYMLPRRIRINRRR